MKFYSTSELFTYLEQNAEKYHYRSERPLPKPFVTERAVVRAIVLGTDPSSDGGHTFEYVFGLQPTGSSAYFHQIKRNLFLLGITTDEVYVQNLCQNYFTQETSRNPKWKEVAGLWVNLLRQELDSQFKETVPIFLTARILVDVLSNSYQHTPSRSFYQRCHVIAPSENSLGRTLIPLFRHRAYQLHHWPEYVQAVQGLL